VVRKKTRECYWAKPVDVDPQAKRVFLRDWRHFEYDSLNCRHGDADPYYGNDSLAGVGAEPEVRRRSTAIRHKILYAFERAERAATPEEARAWLTFIIVGAGATGSNSPEHSRKLLARRCPRFSKNRPKKARIILMEGAPGVLAHFQKICRPKAEKLVAAAGGGSNQGRGW